jgi:hypothetical protein
MKPKVYCAFGVLVFVISLAGCSWYGGEETHALYEAIFDMRTAGNKLNANYIYPEGASIEGYIDYRSYFTHYTSQSTYWKLDYSSKVEMLTTMSDGTTYSNSGTYYSRTANEGTIAITFDDGSKDTLTWNSQDTCPNCLANYIEFYTVHTYNIPALGGDVEVWMLYHNRRN